MKEKKFVESKEENTVKSKRQVKVEDDINRYYDELFKEADEEVIRLYFLYIEKYTTKAP